MIRLVYWSEAVQPVSAALLRDVRQRAERHNEVHGITGMLVASSFHFLQAIEGQGLQVNQLYRNLMLDDRHRSLNIMRCEAIETRRFAGWSMGVVGPDGLSRAVVLRHSAFGQFDPTQMSAESALGLLVDLSTDVPQRAAS